MTFRIRACGLGAAWGTLALVQPVVAFADTPESTQFELPEVRVVATSPSGGAGIAIQNFPGNVQVINSKDMPHESNGFAELLNQVVGSVNLNDTQGNPYQVDVNYRGFTASPVLGTPQGLSVFLDGMRMNEPFGDVVSWDLIPQIAIANITLIPGSNPVYGLNTLGGAVSMNTKSGFSFPGSSVKATLGSFGRRSLDLEQGGHGDYTDYYLAASSFDQTGWAVSSSSRIRQLFGKFGFQDESTDIDLSMMYADNRMYGSQTVPLSMLGDASQGYSHPDYTSAQSYMLNLRGNHDLGGSNTLSGNVYYRHIQRSILNSNVNQWVGGSTNTPGCASVQDCPGANLLAAYNQDDFGSNLQWSNKDRLGNMPQVLTVGLNAEYGRTGFNNSGQDAYVAAGNNIVGVDAFLPQAQVKSINRRFGLFATDTLNVTQRLAVTASARYDYAYIALSGSSCTDNNALCDAAATLSPTPGSDTLADVSGQHSYHRINPAFGLTYDLTPSLTGFANYSEGFRTPSAIELACADPNAPCNGLPNAFSSDPDLKAVVSKTIELGLRGKLDAQLQWQAAAFRSVLHNDIVFNQTNAVQGYFANVGQTRRQGLEFSLDGRRSKLDYGLSLSWVDARFESPFALSNGANSTCLASPNGCSGAMAMPGDHMPGIPALTLKLRLGYQLTGADRVSTSIQAQGSQYARGDENNQDVNGKVPGFATVRLDWVHKLGKDAELFVGVSNLFNTQYSNFGILGFNNISSGQAEQFRSVAAPRSLYAGFQAHY